MQEEVFIRCCDCVNEYRTERGHLPIFPPKVEYGCCTTGKVIDYETHKNGAPMWCPLFSELKLL